MKLRAPKEKGRIRRVATYQGRLLIATGSTTLSLEFFRGATSSPTINHLSSMGELPEDVRGHILGLSFLWECDAGTALTAAELLANNRAVRWHSKQSRVELWCANVLISRGNILNYPSGNVVPYGSSDPASAAGLQEIANSGLGAPFAPHPFTPRNKIKLTVVSPFAGPALGQGSGKEVVLNAFLTVNEYQPFAGQ